MVIYHDLIYFLILTFFAFAVLCTFYSFLKTWTMLICALISFTVAWEIVLVVASSFIILSLCYLFLKCEASVRHILFNTKLTFLIILVVAATMIITIYTILLYFEAFAMHCQALSIDAIATFFILIWWCIG